MPYSLPVHSQGRPGHRRSSSYAGAFIPLGDLPRRRSSTDMSTKFHLNDDDDDDSSSHDESNDRDRPPPLRLKINQNSFNAVPFPRSSPLPSPSLPPPPRPSVTRTASTPTVLLLSNGKPLKSSLKSSSSSPNIPFPAQSLVPSLMFPDLHRKQQPQHQRATSAPCTPFFGTSSSSSSPSSPSSPHSPSFHVSKNVHFPAQESGLATVRLFNRSARPASLSRLGEETETETEGESSTGWGGKYVPGSTFPFPRVPKEKEKERNSPLNPQQQQQQQKKVSYDIDWSQSSIIPRKTLDLATENVYFESLQLVSGLDSGKYKKIKTLLLLHITSLIHLLESILKGTLLVRNITYQKTVMVRYTMDEWETVNDVLAAYHPAVEEIGNGWDRFKFSISLAGRLENRVVWLVGKYAGGAAAAQVDKGEGVEWWDNNQGKNYKVGFRKLDDSQEETETVYKRSLVMSAPGNFIYLFIFLLIR